MCKMYNFQLKSYNRNIERQLEKKVFMLLKTPELQIRSDKKIRIGNSGDMLPWVSIKDQQIKGVPQLWLQLEIELPKNKINK